MENTFKHIIVATSHFVVHKQQTAQMRLRLMLLKRHIMFSDRQWRIIGSTHNATQTREPPRQEDQRLF